MIKKKLTLEEFQQIAKNHGGICLSNKYVNNKTKLEFLCQKGHQFLTRPTSIKRGSWCDKCSSDNTRLTIEEFKCIAIGHNGICLSTEYNVEKLKFQCENNHIFEANPHNVKHGSWCGKCNGNYILDIREIKQVAIEQNLTCLSEIYLGNKIKLKFQCNICQYIFEAAPGNVKNSKTGCLKCSGKFPLSIEEFQQIAILRGGVCLSTKYTNITTKLEFQCGKNHIFKALPITVKHRNSWCPKCQVSASELICKAYFEQIFNVKFISIRPNWLKNPKTGRNLELDGYCEELNLAWEHNGFYHFKNNKTRFVKLQQVQERDEIKKQLCKQNNVKLIIIPELFTQTKLDNLYNVIIEQCNEQNISIPNPNKVIVNINKVIGDYYQVDR